MTRKQRRVGRDPSESIHPSVAAVPEKGWTEWMRPFARKTHPSYRGALHQARPGIRQAISLGPRIIGIKHVLMCSRDPGTARNFWPDRGNRANLRGAQNAAVKRAAYDGRPAKAIIGAHVPFGGQNGHPRAHTGATRRAIQLSRLNRDHRHRAQCISVTGNRTDKHAKGMMPPIWIGWVFERQLLIGRIGDPNPGFRYLARVFRHQL